MYIFYIITNLIYNFRGYLVVHYTDVSAILNHSPIIGNTGRLQICYYEQCCFVLRSMPRVSLCT